MVNEIKDVEDGIEGEDGEEEGLAGYYQIHCGIAIREK